MNLIIGRGCLVAFYLTIALSSSVTRADEAKESPQQQPAGASATFDVRGRVVMESDGKPVANAEVRLVTWTSNNTHYDVKKAKANEKGEFVFERVAPGKHRLIAFFEDFASRRALYKGELVDQASKEPVTLRLVKMPRIDVRVTSNADGKPIEGALVRLIWSDTDRDHRTDQAGSVTLRALTHEVWHVEVKAKGFAEQEQAVNLTETQAAKVKFALLPGGVLFGVVKDEGGKPVEKVGISVFPADHRGGQIEYLTTDSDGRFRFDSLPIDQKLELGFSKDNYLSAREQIALTDAVGEERELNYVLKQRPHGGTVRGTVSDVAGKPIAGAEVSNHGRSSREVRSTTSDDTGNFVLDNLYEGSLGHELVVKAKGFAPQQLPFTPSTKEKPGEIAVTLRKGHGIRGYIVNEAGSPVAGAFVRYEVSSGSAMEINGRTTTDAEGHFELDSLPEEPTFSIQAEGYSEFESAKLPLDGTDRVKITLEPQGMIRGKVVDAETRKPIDTFNVRITFSPDRTADDPGHHLSGARATEPNGERFVNAYGLFSMNDLLRKMPLQVTVTAEGYERGTYRRVVAESADDSEVIDFPLLPIDESKLITIRGRIVDSQGTGVAGTELRLIVTDSRAAERDRFPYNWQMIRSGQTGSVAEVSQFVSAVSGADGKFAFVKVRPGLDMEIAYWGDGVSQGRLDGIQRLSEDERENVTIINVAPGVIRGAIDRKALPKASSVTLFSKGDRSFSGDYSDHLSADEKEYEIQNLPPGSYELQVYGEALRTGNRGFRRDVVQRHAVEIRSGETLTFDLGGKSDQIDGERKSVVPD